MKSVKELDAAGKVVFYRPDYNVPLKNGVIADDFRIQATIPTLEILIQKDAKIIIGSHLGRPDGQYKKEFDLRPIAEYLADHFENRVVRMAHEVENAEVKAAIKEMSPGDILLLPNLRFYPGEEANDTRFAAALADLADVYVNDAFACDHRAHASIVGVPTILPAFAGLLVEKEVSNLGSLIEKPASPFVLVMGGAKVSDKIDMIKKLGVLADKILVGGAMANTFLLAQGEEIGGSKAESEKVGVAKELLEMFGDKIILAEDYLQEGEGQNAKYMDIGEKAVENFKTYLTGAKTVFWNGSLGYTEDERFAGGSREIAKCLAGLKGATTTIIAGGDTVEMITRLGLRDAYTWVSTGGGAALEFLAGIDLPGIKVLDSQKSVKEEAKPEVKESEEKEAEVKEGELKEVEPETKE